MAMPRTQFYHPARVIDAALHGIERAIRRAEGIGLVVGPPGTGKSLLLAKVGESVGDDFRVALLSGTSICTRRALWQSILANLGQPYRGIDEAELRIALAELVRELAATGSGLVILVDEAHTLPLRLLEELRLLANMPTPLPAVHIVLAGTSAVEERLGSPKMESFAQRIAVRAYLEPLDHAETVAYLRTQTRAAGLDWERCFESGCDDAVYSTADGVPRLINQVCDQALVLVAGVGRRVRPTDILAAWQEIQRLPALTLFAHAVGDAPQQESAPAADGLCDAGHLTDLTDLTDGFSDSNSAGPADGYPDGYVVHELGGEGSVGVIEFGSLDDREAENTRRPFADISAVVGPADDEASRLTDPFQGPDVEFVFDTSADPFQELFEQEERVVERYVIRSQDDFCGHQRVASTEGAALVRQLVELPGSRQPDVVGSGGGRLPVNGDGVDRAEAADAGPVLMAATEVVDDADMVVIEEDLFNQPAGRPVVAAVRLGDYRLLFARLRRGG